MNNLRKKSNALPTRIQIYGKPIDTDQLLPQAIFKMIMICQELSVFDNPYSCRFAENNHLIFLNSERMQSTAF